MAITATVTPRDARVNSKGVTVSFAATEDFDLNSYSMLVNVPCNVTIEPIATPVDGEWVIDGELGE